MDFGIRKHETKLIFLFLMSYGIWDKSPNFSKPQFFYSAR